MADRNNENKYLLLSHNNPLIKTIADFMESERIYEIGDDGKVLPDSQAVDKFFDFNREFIWKQMTESNKMKVKDENGSYPKSAQDLKKTNTLPCPCKLKVRSGNVTAELAINATNAQVNTSDVYAFANEQIQELYQNEGFVADESTKREITCSVFGWFKSLYYAYTVGNNKQKKYNREAFNEFADLSKHIINLSTSVGANGGSFSFRLPVVGVKKIENDLYEPLYNKLVAPAYVGRGKKDEYRFNDDKEFYAKTAFSSVEGNYFNWLISNNDIIFISFERLKMETYRDKNIADSGVGDEDNFDIKTAIASGVYDMIGLVDSVKVVSGAGEAEAYVEVTGRDLMKLLIEDGSWFFNTSTTADPSSVFANEAGYGASGDIRGVDEINGKYGNTSIKRLRRPAGEIDIFANQLNMPISYILKAVLSQLSNVEVVPGFVFQSWGDERTKYNDYYEEKK